MVTSRLDFPEALSLQTCPMYPRSTFDLRDFFKKAKATSLLPHWYHPRVTQWKNTSRGQCLRESLSFLLLCWCWVFSLTRSTRCFILVAPKKKKSNQRHTSWDRCTKRYHSATTVSSKMQVWFSFVHCVLDYHNTASNSSPLLYSHSRNLGSSARLSDYLG